MKLYLSIVLIVVGGYHNNEIKKVAVLNRLKSVSVNVKLVACICKGAFLLASANIITNKNIITHFQDLDDLQDSFPKIKCSW